MNANTRHIVNQLRLQSIAREGQPVLHGSYPLSSYRRIDKRVAQCRPYRIEQQATRNTEIYRTLESMHSSDTDGRVLMERMIAIRKQYYVAFCIPLMCKW